MPKQFGSQLDLQKIPVLNIVVQQAASPGPLTPVAGQLWWDTTNSQLKVCTNATGPVWTQADNVTGGTASNVSDGDKGAITVTSGVWALDPNTVNSANIVDGTIVAGDLAPGTIPTTLPPSGAAGGDLTGSTYPNPVIATGAVTSAKILDGTIVDTDVAAANKDGAVGTFSLRTLGFGIQQAMQGNTKLNNITAPNGAVVMNGFGITSLLDPTSPQDAATKNYVDLAAQGLDPKASVKAASTVSFASGGVPTGALTTDGYAVVTGDRILMKDQSSAQNNGIWIANTAGAWTRATDMDVWAEVPGAFVFVEQGTVQADTGWLSTADAGGTIGTTAMPWVQFSGAGQVIAGAGLTKTGNQIDVVGANAISVGADLVSLLLAGGGSSGLVQSGSGLSLLPKPNAGLTTDTSGAYVALKPSGGILVDSSGLYVDPATTTGLTKKFSGLVGALTAGVETMITHSLGTQDVVASFRDATTNRVIEFEWRCASTTQIGITADLGYAANAIRATVIG